MKNSLLHHLASVLAIGLLLALSPVLAHATTFTVTVGDGGFRFSPQTVAVQVGDTVQWTWSASGHTSTSGTPGFPNGLWDSGFLNQGDTFSFTFNTAGSFPYFCTAHGECCGMIGTVTVASPTPTPTPTPSATPTPTPTPTPSATPTATPTILGNISTRLSVGTGDNVLFAGFIITGTQPKKVIIRGIGPSLPNVTPVLADPTLELLDSSQNLLDSNDNWMDSPDKQAIIDSTIPPTNDLESAIVATLPANGSGYTAILSGVNNGTGIGVLEVYDLDQSVDSKLANISTRGVVSTGDNLLIAGTIVLGDTPQKVLIRAIGPSLTLPGALPDPMLELHDASGVVIQSNDNWRSDQEAEIIATTIPPTNDLESALIATLPANGASYTAVVSGVGGTTGIAVVEIYALE